MHIVEVNGARFALAWVYDAAEDDGYFAWNTLYVCRVSEYAPESIDPKSTVLEKHLNRDAKRSGILLSPFCEIDLVLRRDDERDYAVIHDWQLEYGDLTAPLPGFEHLGGDYDVAKAVVDSRASELVAYALATEPSEGGVQ